MISAEDMAEVKRQFTEHGVVYFRGIGGPNGEQITPEEHMRFAEQFGPINVNRFFPKVDGYPAIAKVEKMPEQKLAIGENFHADHTYDLAPAMGSVLVARALPKTGGDTLFVSMYKAYESLPEEIKRELVGLRAVHSSRHAFGASSRSKEQKNLTSNPELAMQDNVHPVVITHPLSGRKALFVNPGFTIHFEGKTFEESQPLLRTLYKHTLQPAHIQRFHFEPGSAVLWDNRAVWHCAINDYPGQYRLMHRITIEGVELEAADAKMPGSMPASYSGPEMMQDVYELAPGQKPGEQPWMQTNRAVLETGLGSMGIPSWREPLVLPQQALSAKL